MILEISKQISKKDAKRIALLCKKVKTLQKLQDGIFLREAIVPQEIKWKNKKNYVEFIADKDIGPIIFPERGKLERDLNNDIFYSITTNKEKIEKVNFIIALHSVFKSISASIENMQTHLKEITIDPMSSKQIIEVGVDLNLKEMTRDPREDGNRGNIYALAVYFYNKLEAYEKVHRFLLENRNLSARIGEPYLEALISLFSAGTKKKKILPFKLPEEGTCFPCLDKDFSAISAAALGSIEYYSPFSNGRLDRNLSIYLLLSETGTLLFEAIPPYGALIQEDPAALLAFINKNTNAWLNNVEQMTNFGFKICNKVRTKILISST